MATYDLSKVLNTQISNDDVLTVFDIINKDSDISKFIKKGLVRDSFLKKFFCTNDLGSLPYYWQKIQDYSSEKGLFTLFALLTLNINIIQKFSSKFSNKTNGGEYEFEKTGQGKVIREALISSGASESFDSKSDIVPYDFSIALYNTEVGKLFKALLIDRLRNAFPEVVTNDGILFEICKENNFGQALGISHEGFINWLSGKANNGSYIKSVEISDFFCVKDPINLDFENSKEIYLLGKNGDGKTLLLMAIYLAFNGNRVMTYDNDKVGKAQQIYKISPKLSGTDDTGRPYGKKYSSYLEKSYAYGTHRGRHGATSEAEKYGFMSLFDINQTMINPLEWLKSIVFRSYAVSGGKIEDNVVDDISSNPLVIEEKKESELNMIQEIFDKILDRHVKIVLNDSKSEFLFEEDGAKLTLDALSEGYRSVIVFICDLLCRLYGEHFSTNEAIKETKAVVMVDEIDAHLHPSWQRKIVSKLRELFPNIQFIFTTHSPSIIQGASSEDAIIFRVYRDEGQTKVSDPYYKKKLDHMMLNTLMTSSLFGLDEARLDSNNDDADTADSFLAVRIEERLRKRIKEEKLGSFLTDDVIEKMIEEAMKEEGLL